MEINNLKEHLPEHIFSELPAIIDRFEINNKLRLAHFLGQCSHESANFTVLSENLNYSAQGLKLTFPKYFKDDQTAEAYARHPEKIGARVYAGRMGNGDEESGDGFRFRGRGCIQLTGKDNYSHFGASIGADLIENPDRVKTEFPLTSAGWFFDIHKLNGLADKGLDEVGAITKIINGGFLGLKDRTELTNKFYNLLNNGH